MSDEQAPAPPPTGRRYKEWEHSYAEEVAFSRKIFFGMMIALAILLGALTYGALR
ncbi:hypothetical protein [Paramagnetospirillum magneticum]|uniref:Uncharacterized protein n=1 Tax=Paramagnetospirillum magneticum (strain ATCC 700264 / AMB-1) TaxID=342108 RepID=Q2VYM6_PARM1|nr:hypothetical protein [Paramagnetospirillum magneticum]BAE53299.1 hypothetical protein amb4495 [Paramagnetospirillum magneticum AMB-1]